MKALVWAANTMGWPIIHIAVARAALWLPGAMFASDTCLTREHAFEQGGRLYRDTLRVASWKRLLPDGAPWLGGFSKKRIHRRDSEYLVAFIAETRRAEWAHWMMLACTPVFYLWNPAWACMVMTAYGLLANLPCIVAQRANRIQLMRMEQQARRRSAIVFEAVSR